MNRHGLAWYICSSLLLLLSLHPSVCKATESVFSENDFYRTDIPIVISASRMQQTAATAPVAITIIDRQMIEASGFTEIPDLMRLVPGYFVDYDSGYSQVVGYHMLPNVYFRHQQVLIDGRSVYTPVIGGVPWTDLGITLDDIERIEVVRGPNVVSFGSNSFLGVINIITRHASLDGGTSIKANYGTHSLREGFLRQGGNAAGVDYRINLGYRSDDGFTNRGDEKIVRLFNTRFDYTIDKRNDLSFQAGYSGSPRLLDYPYGGPEPYLTNTTSQYQQLRWENKSSSDEGFYLQIYHNFIQENNSVPNSLPDIDLKKLGERYDIETQFNGRTQNKLRYIIGASYRLDRVTGPIYFGTDTPLDSRYRRLFGSVEHPVADNTLLNVGLMIENNEVVGTDISPRIAINQAISDTETLRVSYSRATRTPVMFEEYPDPYTSGYTTPNPVKAERITAYDIGFVGKYLTNSLNYDLRIFYEDIYGLISAVNNQFDNYDDALIRGAEIQLDWRPTHVTRIHAGYSHIKIESANIADNYTTSAPANAAQLLLTQQLADGYNISTGIYHKGPMKPLAPRSGYPDVLSATTRVDVQISKQFKFENTTQKLAFVIQNLFDETDLTFTNNSIDRRAHITYKIDF